MVRHQIRENPYFECLTASTRSKLLEPSHSVLLDFDLREVA